MTEVARRPEVARSRQTRDTPTRQHETALSAWATFLQAHAAVIRRLGTELESQTGISTADYNVPVTLPRAGRTRRPSGPAATKVLSRSAMTLSAYRPQNAPASAH